MKVSWRMSWASEWVVQRFRRNDMILGSRRNMRVRNAGWLPFWVRETRELSSSSVKDLEV